MLAYSVTIGSSLKGLKQKIINFQSSLRSLAASDAIGCGSDSFGTGSQNVGAIQLSRFASHISFSSQAYNMSEELYAAYERQERLRRKRKRAEDARRQQFFHRHTKRKTAEDADLVPATSRNVRLPSSPRAAMVHPRTPVQVNQRSSPHCTPRKHPEPRHSFIRPSKPAEPAQPLSAGRLQAPKLRLIPPKEMPSREQIQLLPPSVQSHTGTANPVIRRDAPQSAVQESQEQVTPARNGDIVSPEAHSASSNSTALVQIANSDTAVIPAHNEVALPRNYVHASMRSKVSAAPSSRSCSTWRRLYGFLPASEDGRQRRPLLRASVIDSTIDLGEAKAECLKNLKESMGYVDPEPVGAKLPTWLVLVVAILVAVPWTLLALQHSA